MIILLEKRKAINGLYYASEFWQWKETIKPKRRGKLMAGVLLLQNKLPIHATQFVVAEASNCGFELYPYPLTQ